MRGLSIRVWLGASALCVASCIAQQPLPAKNAASAPQPTAEATPRPNPIAINREPRCGPAVDEMALDDSWVATPEMQRSVHALEDALAPFSASYLGVAMDNANKRAVVVFHSDFSDYEFVRQRLLGKVEPLKVVLQPSCYSRKQLADAERVLTKRAWHPRARRAECAFYLDASFSGFHVTIDDAAPDVADTLKRKLGKLVRVHSASHAEHDSQSLNDSPSVGAKR